MMAITLRKQTHKNVNKTWVRIQTTGCKEHRFYGEIVANITTRNSERKDI